MDIRKITYKNNYYKITSMKYLERLCLKNNISMRFLCIYNEINEFKEGDIIILPNNFNSHIVKPLEKLEDIAFKYKVSKNYILENNKIRDIFIGEKLFL